MKPDESRRLPRVLDQEAWDAPPRLTDADLFAHAGDGWRRAGPNPDEIEDAT